MSKRPPHIVIFNPDQWRWDVMGHMGNPAAVTPNLDHAVATDAVSFRNAFCQNPVCTPSRCSFMTGWYTHVAGHRTMFHMLREHEPMLLKTLKDHGYFVWWGGKNDLVPGQNDPLDYVDVYYRSQPTKKMPPYPNPDWRGEPGDDTYYSFYVGKLDKGDEEIYLDTDWRNVLGAIEMIKNRPADKPLCIYLPLGFPHPPYKVEEPYYSMIDRAKLPPRIPAPEDWTGKPSIERGIWRNQGLDGWTEDRWTELRATYYGMCARVDDQFGRVMDALREAGIYDDTAVFLFSDHGDFTGDYGLVEKTQNTFEDVLSRVPFVVKPPKDVPVKPRVSDAMVELIDFPATVEALTGIQPDHDHFGKSLLPVLSGETDTHRDACFCEGGRRRGEYQAMELESRQVDDTTGLYWPRLVLQGGEGPEHSKAVMCRTKEYKYTRRLYESDELYDLVNDPGETINLIHDPAYADVLIQMRDRMLHFFLETGDVVPHDTDRRSFDNLPDALDNQRALFRDRRAKG